MSRGRGIVVVGAGLAGARTAEALRSFGYDGRLVLVGDETDRPYIRPPLSKEYLRGEADLSAAFVHDETWYDDNDVELLLGEHVEQVELLARSVRLGSGGGLDFDALALTTGASSRTLDVPGADAHHVHLLRSRGESDALRRRLQDASRLAIVGSGWIGLEVAAAARAAGVDVVVLERAPIPIGFLGAELSDVLVARHRDQGVAFRVGVEIDALVSDPGGDVAGVHLTDGTTIEADTVLVAVGAVPNDGLAERAGLVTDGGILTDDELRSSHPDVFAAGDVARAFHPRTGGHERVEHWATAERQPGVMAAAMLGIPATYSRLPYFFSDQYDLSFQVSGFVSPGGYERVVTRGDTSSTSFSMFWLNAGRVVAGLAAGDAAFDDVERLVRDAPAVSTRRLADADVPLAELGHPEPVEEGA